MTAKPTPPAGLGARGSAFWEATVAVFEVTDVEGQLLLECCRLLDECEELQRAIATDGVTVAGSTGQKRVHPAIGELRQHRLALGRLLAQLALPDEDDETLRSPTSARAQKAAQARWAAQRERQTRGTA